MQMRHEFFDRKQFLCKIPDGAPDSAAVSFFVGPEGGIATEEAAALQAAGIVPISLGHRILRTENAAMYVLPILQYINEKGSAVCPDKK